jgi:hypothetical protein
VAGSEFGRAVTVGSDGATHRPPSDGFALTRRNSVAIPFEMGEVAEDLKKGHMKRAVIVVGAHHTGKSETINKHLKPLLGIGYDDHKFVLNGQWGFIYSQTDVESKRDILVRIKIMIEMSYELIVVAARPKTEPGSKLSQLCDLLRDEKFQVKMVEIENRDGAQEAQSIFEFLNLNVAAAVAA